MQKRLLLTLFALLLAVMVASLSAQDDDTEPITLRFAVRAELPDPRLMNDFVETFAAEDPAVGEVVWEVGSGEIFDCSTTNTRGVFIGFEPLDLTPLLADDPTFDENEYLTGIFDQVTTAEGEVLGLPLAFVSEALWINTTSFTENDIPLPLEGWTIDEFTDAIVSLDRSSVIGFGGRTFDNRALLLFAGSLGAAPLDYRTTPPTPTFSTPETIEATNAINNLVVGGTFSGSYRPLFSLDFFSRSIGLVSPQPIQTDRVGQGSNRLLAIDTTTSLPLYIPIPYPTNPEGPTVVSYSPISGYINANSDHIDACYRLLRALSDRPDVFYSPPAKLTVLTSETFLDSDINYMADYVTAFEAKLAASIESPVVLPLGYSDLAFWPNMWFNRALDQIVAFEDPETVLSDAQGFVEAYYECVAPLLDDPDLDTMFIDPAEDITPECAQQVDPTGYALLFGEDE